MNHWRRGNLRLASSALLAAAALLVGTCGTENAAANGDTRTLTFYHTHTHERAQITFKRDGRYDIAALEQLNHFLRDWRNDKETRMDPRLFDVVWEVYREVGSHEPIHIVSAYRSPETNAMLHRRSHSVAEHSQHMLGKAMDFFLPDASIEKIRETGMRLQDGGVGYYPRSGSPFVHLDVGSVRSWPRMPRDQLVKLFPDGKTVHIPADGTPLKGYELAKAEILARGGSVAGQTALAYASNNEPLTTGTNPMARSQTASQTSEPSAKPVFASLFGDRKSNGGKPAGRIGQPVLASAGDGADIVSFFRRDKARQEAQAKQDDKPVQPATGSAAIPLPPHRPASLAASYALANVPMPPARPVGIASLVPLARKTLDKADSAGLAALAGQAASRALAFAPAQPAWQQPATGAGHGVGAPLQGLARIEAVHAANPTYSSEHTLRELIAAAATGTITKGAPGKLQQRAH